MFFFLFFSPIFVRDLPKGKKINKLKKKGAGNETLFHVLKNVHHIISESDHIIFGYCITIKGSVTSSGLEDF